VQSSKVIACQLLTAFALSGCTLFGGLQARTVAVSAQKPSNVAVYLSVVDGRDPVVDLGAENFTIYENGELIGADQTRQTLLPRDVSAIHRTLLLVDVSGASDGRARATLTTAIRGFVDKVRRTQAVTVYVFDGSPQPRLFGEHDLAPEEVETDTHTAPEKLQPRDSSRNLNGAVLDGLKQLDARLMSVKKPLRVGTLVVYSGGPDLAGRVTTDQLIDRLEQTAHHVVAIGVGEQDGSFSLESIGVDGTIRAEAPATLPIAFEEAASRVGELFDMYYLLAYCSPARAGVRQLRIEVTYTTREGDEKRASLEQDFDASGFQPGCDPNSAPRFVSVAPATPEKPARP
jgi:hypothetical protein